MNTAMRPDELEKRIETTKARLARLESQDDPGVGRPPAEATRLREQHLRSLRTTGDELGVLEAERRATDPAEIARRTFGERLARWARGRAIAEAQTDEDRNFLRGLHETMREREHERETKRKREELRERLTNPPDPRAVSILAAVAAEESLLDSVEVKLRPIEGEEGMTADNVLDAKDIGVLLIALHLLRERGSFVVEDWGAAPRWPRREPPIVPVERLKASLLELRRLGYLAVEVSGGTARVTYGPLVRGIAEKWGIALAE